MVEQTKDYDVMIQADSAGDYGINISTDLPSLLNKLLSIDQKIKIGIQGLNPLYFVKYFDFFTEFIEGGVLFTLEFQFNLHQIKF